MCRIIGLGGGLGVVNTLWSVLKSAGDRENSSEMACGTCPSLGGQNHEAL